MDWIPVWFLQRPRLLWALGRGLASAGGILFVAGMAGRLATGAAALFQPAGKAAVTPRLAELYPSVPTGWIPESWLGFVVPLALFAFGVWLAWTGRQLVRQLDAEQRRRRRQRW